VAHPLHLQIWGHTKNVGGPLFRVFAKGWRGEDASGTRLTAASISAASPSRIEIGSLQQTMVSQNHTLQPTPANLAYRLPKRAHIVLLQNSCQAPRSPQFPATISFHSENKVPNHVMFTPLNLSYWY
jgi:hypothetical protein